MSRGRRRTPQREPDLSPTGVTYAALVGKTILVGVTFTNGAGEITCRRQWWGVITGADAEYGISVDLRNSSDPCVLPPELRAIQPAEPGEYRLRETGEVVVDPDFLTTWTCIQREESAGEDPPSF